jgi:hypothetical protein
MKHGGAVLAPLMVAPLSGTPIIERVTLTIMVTRHDWFIIPLLFATKENPRKPKTTP